MRTSPRLMLLLSFLLFSSAALAAESKPTACTGCHGETVSPENTALVRAYKDDVHARAGLSCHDCHGGNPDARLVDDMGAAMDSGFKPNPYRGAPERGAIPEFCGHCHSSLDYMRKFRPAARVDQVEEYWTSRHGRALKAGDTAVATCIDCHGVHGMRGVDDPLSRVYPTKVAETCGSCHSDAKRMAGRRDERGVPLSVDQQARWRQSVHAAALIDRGDLSAPTCNDCHGNHGATPPGITSVANVCGQCHGREAELFRKSPKAEGFAAHNEFLATEPAGCVSCHDALPASVTSMKHFSECVVCHENHGVTRPTVALLGFLPDVPCAFCHEGGGAIGEKMPETEKKAAHYRQVRDALLQAAAAQKLTGDARFDWMVDQALKLDTHLVTGGPAEKRLRPEFARLFEKFRIGKTHYGFVDPVTGKTKTVALRKCTDCHSSSDSTGWKAAQRIVESMREVTALTARAERTLLTAQRGGVEVRGVHSELDAAVDNQIELEVLVHSFATDGTFTEKQKEAVNHASAALVAGGKSLEELSNRRVGLGAALGIIALVLVALGLKIRDLSGR